VTYREVNLTTGIKHRDEKYSVNKSF